MAIGGYRSHSWIKLTVPGPTFHKCMFYENKCSDITDVFMEGLSIPPDISPQKQKKSEFDQFTKLTTTTDFMITHKINEKEKTQC